MGEKYMIFQVKPVMGPEGFLPTNAMVPASTTLYPADKINMARQDIAELGKGIFIILPVVVNE